MRSVVALTGKPHASGTPCEVSTVIAAVNALDARLAKEDAERRAKDANWLADQFDGLSPNLERPDK
ncbi:MAG TPA: hypothetical protein VHW01_01705 [Polyangiaceae bacterium]|nr:hypothetical protein [Polyangiaceae bacterium]